MKKNNELIEKFNVSRAMAKLSDEDKKTLLTAIEEGEEITIKRLESLLEGEILTERFFDEKVEEISNEIAEQTIRTLKRRKLARKIQRKEKKDRSKADKILKLLN